jgi:diguanylate cyclase (GGDEF)-like protein
MPIFVRRSLLLELLVWLAAAMCATGADPTLAARMAAGATEAAPLRADEAAAAPDSQGWSALADTLFRRLEAPELRYAEGLAEDGQGFIWAGTGGGLTRWDGYRTRVYQADPQDPGALPDNHVLALHTDRLGRLWVGTSVGGLARYDPQQDRFVVVPAGPGGLSDACVSAIAADGDQGLWIVTGAGLDHLDFATGKVRRASPANREHGVIKVALQDADGTLWLGTTQGLFRQAFGRGAFQPVRISEGRVPQFAVTGLAHDSSGRLWIAASLHGVFVIEPGQTSARAVLESGHEPHLQGEIVRSMLEVTPGQMWLGTAGGGLVAVATNAGWTTRRIRHRQEDDASLRDDDVGAMLRDRSGLVWVSSTLALNVHDPRQIGISTLFGSDTGNKPVSTLQVPFVLARPDGRVWLSRGDPGGIDILDPLRGRVAEVPPDPARPLTALPKGRVYTMALGPSGEVYAGTAAGLYRVDAKGRQVARIDLPQRRREAAVYSLFLDGSTLWIGGSDGLWQVEIHAAGPPTLLRHDRAEQIGGDRVSAILRGTGQTLWVGTASGLVRLDLGSGEMTRLPTDPKDPQALLAGYVASLLLDERGRLWVASIGSGLQVIEQPQANGRLRVRRLGMREGMPHNGVDMLFLDGRGKVWASTDGGLAEIDTATFAVRSLGPAQGVAIQEYWSNSGAKTAKGELLFGGQGGLTVVRPWQTVQQPEPPKVVVTEAHAGDQSVPPGRFNGPSERWDLPAHDRSLMVEFAALDLTAPRLNRYSYRLLGFDDEWHDTATGHRLATYTNLPPGDYTLELRGRGHDPQGPASTLAIPVKVLPDWYQTASFRFAAALAGVLAVGAIVQLRTTYLRRRQRVLQMLVARRTAQLEASSAELRASQRELIELAYVDPLTGLGNRRRFNEDLQHVLALALRGVGEATLLLIDLDKFKQLNDSMGHDAGDALLVEVAQRLRSTVRQVDRVARLGGDEFAVLLLDGMGHAQPEVACQRILTRLTQPFDHAGRSLQVSASVGAAACPEQATDGESLYKCADLALYAAKRSGGGSWRWYASELGTPLDSRATEPASLPVG